MDTPNGSNRLFSRFFDSPREMLGLRAGWAVRHAKVGQVEVPLLAVENDLAIEW